jgi:Fur family ferric uptake transcriptional regulator
LAEAGLAKAVNFGDGVTRYEFCYGLPHHDHLICERCRRNIEVVDDDIERLQEELAKKHGFTLTRHKMYLYGVCPECRDKGRDED